LQNNIKAGMTEKEAGQYWNDNAEAWTELARAGFDIYRDYLNTPAFFSILPDVNNLSGIDIGCGEGHNTRLLAQKGASIKAIDISELFIRRAREMDKRKALSIEYITASATELPFKNESFDFATSFMCLMDIPNPNKALQEIYRVLKTNGFLQFSITHPCFTTPHRKNLRNSNNHKTYAIEVGDYFKNLDGKVSEWIFCETPGDLKKAFPKFKTPIFNRTLTEWFTSIIETGFIIEEINEPYADEETVSKMPALQDTQIVGYFLHVRCRK
jgi:ubiquinone/menaquinone biosynthesis C-methylase UbiE